MEVINMSKNKICKVGNTTLEWDESKACRTQEEIQAILDDIVTGAKRSIIAAEVAKMQKDNKTAS